MAEKNKIPLIVMEEHKEAYYVWHIFSAMGKINRFGNILLHVDHHPDNVGGVYNFTVNTLAAEMEHNLEYSKYLSYEELGIADFILPAVFERMFTKWIFLENFGNKVHFEKKYIEHRYEAYNGTRMDNLSFVGVADKLKKQIDEYDKRHVMCNLCGVEYFSGGLGDYGDFNSPVVLDIDLDYFCWSDSLKNARDLVFEITEDCWDRIMGDTYSPPRLMDKKYYRYFEKDDRHFVEIINPARYESDEKITQDILRERVDKFFAWLKNQKFVPAAIDICRSRISGYLNTDYFPLVENEVLRRLDELYGTEVLFRPEI